MRAIAICTVLAACAGPDLPPAAPGAPTAPRARSAATAPTSAAIGPADPAPAGPGARLVEGVAPIAYDLTLELDPDRDAFAGRVEIAIAAAPGTARLWLHAAELAIARAVVRRGGRDEPVELLDGPPGSQLRGFALARPVGAGERIALAIDYTGRVSEIGGGSDKSEEGLFRERAGERWYLYSQAESIFARRIAPCFDEPRFKPAWRVTAIVPRGMVALGNAPVAAERALPDGRREVRFREIAALPSYLLAVAVGPFELVDAGALGRGRIPVRIAVPRGDGGRVGAAVRELPRIIDALESYLDAQLPVAKLDLVAVPEFFGAMENVGLVTFASSVLVDGHDFVGVAAHELAHQWFGNAVTAAWWDDLWLSEAFASWLADRVAIALDGAPPPEMAHRARSRALGADDDVDARALVHPIASTADIEPTFDAIAYEKGAAVLATFERFVGEAAFRAAVQAYLAAHAGRSVTSRAFLDALAAAAGRRAADALASNLVHPGTPVVELALRCGPAPAIIASARAGVAVPVCVRFPSGAAPTRACFLADRRTEHPLPAAAGCPAWIADNDGGDGYYRAVWPGGAPRPPVGQLSPGERLARGDDGAIAVRRGELALEPALAELTALAAPRDPYGQLAALAIARAIDPVIADAERPAWTGWLAARFADRLTRAALARPRAIIDRMLRTQLLDLAAAAVDPALLAGGRTQIGPRSLPGRDASLRFASVRAAAPLFDRIVAGVARTPGDELRGEQLRALGEFSGAFAPRIVELMLGGRFAAAHLVPALAEMLRRGDARTAAGARSTPGAPTCWPGSPPRAPPI